MQCLRKKNLKISIKTPKKCIFSNKVKKLGRHYNLVGGRKGNPLGNFSDHVTYGFFDPKESRIASRTLDGLHSVSVHNILEPLT